MYLSFDIYKITMTSSPTFYCTNEKNCEKNWFFLITPTTLVNTSTSDQEKHGKYGSIGDKQEEKNM